MIVFLFVLSSSVLLCFLDRLQPRGMSQNAIGGDNCRYKPTGWFLLACSIILFFAVFRADTVGSDLVNFKSTFLLLRGGSIANKWEPLYITLQYVVSLFTANFNIFMGVCSVLTLIPMLYVLYYNTNDYLPIAMLIFLAEAYAASFSGLRFSLSYMCIYMALHYKWKQNQDFFKIFLIAGFLFHYTSIILIIIILILDRKLKFYWYLIAAFTTIFLSISGSIWKNLIFVLVPKYSGYINFQYTSYVPALNFALFGILAILCYVYKDKLYERNPRNVLLANMAAVMLLFQIGCWWFPVSIRVSQMFRYFMVFLIPEIIACEDDKGYKTLLIIGFSLFYLLLFIFFVTGKNGVLPYQFFWQVKELES